MFLAPDLAEQEHVVDTALIDAMARRAAKTPRRVVLGLFAAAAASSLCARTALVAEAHRKKHHPPRVGEGITIIVPGDAVIVIHVDVPED
jgi:hypothetical protein